MSLRAIVSGQFNLVDENSNQNFLSFDLATAFGTVSNIEEQTFQERQLVLGDGVVSLDPGGVGTVKGMFLSVEAGGSVTVKHDSNTNGIAVSGSMLIFGQLSSITIETIATQPIKVKYLIFE